MNTITGIEQAVAIVGAVAAEAKQTAFDAGLRATENAWKDNFQLLQNRPNKSGFPKSDFWDAARRGTSSRVTGDGRGEINILQSGPVNSSYGDRAVQLRRYGGTMVPKESKFLTIPANAQAYGKRAREFDNLSVIFGRRKSTGEIGPIALGVRQDVVRRGRRIGPQQPVEIFYWLVKKTTHQPDESVFPSDQTVQDSAERAAQVAVQTMIERITR